MTKLFILVLLVFSAVLITNILTKNVHAETSYLTFQTIRLDRGKLLSKYSDSEYDKYYKYVDKRKMFGWRTYYVNKDVHCSYVSKTVFSYYNRGTSKINYTYNLTDVTTEKFSISSSGSISYSGQSQGTKTFKHGLQSALKLDIDYSKQNQTTTKTNLEITVDPLSVATLKIIGEGRISNGVACDYFFWIRTHRGGFEYFIVSTEYPRLEVLPI